MTNNTDAKFQIGRWTEEHRKNASAQGWDLFEVDLSGSLQIQRDDEANLFSSDVHVIDFLKVDAEHGNTTAILALEIDTFFKPFINKSHDSSDEADIDTSPKI